MARLGRVVAALAVFLALAPRADAGGPPTPAESLAALRLADPALAVTLVAGDPDVSSPVALAWDEFGRLYVAEMTDYPAAPTGGRVKRLEDRDGDGRYERVTVFADRLSYPNGVLPWDGGLLVTAAPDLIFFKDTDGDGKADVRRVVLTGFGEGNQQLRVNGPTYGRDNRVYLANGRSGGLVRRPGDPPGAAVPLPRNDLRLDPVSGRFEPVAGFSQFGLPRDDWGDRFPSWNTVPVRHVVLEEDEAGRDDARTVADVLDPADGGRVYSLAPAQRRFNKETVATFNATCGPTVYRGDLLGDDYVGNVFVCESLTGVVHRRRLEPSGPTYVARRVERGREFLASTHPWFRPVNLTTGPDGALYVADFCRAWVEHPAFVPEGLRNSVDFREGFERGRVWRVAPRGPARKAVSWPGGDDTAGLVARLAHPNGWHRDTAQRLLVERRDAAAIVPLRDLVRSSPSPLARAHALWTLDGLDALDVDTLRAALGDPHPRVREQAARLAEPRAGQAAGRLVSLATDPDERVRLRAAVALGRLDTDAAREALAAIAGRDADSPWTAQVVLAGADPGRFLGTLAARQPSWLDAPTPTQGRFLARLAGRVGADAPVVRAVLDRAGRARGEAAAFALIGGLARGPAAAALPPDDPTVSRLRAAAVVAARDRDRPGWVRALAFEAALATHAAERPAAVLDLLGADQPAALQASAARAAGRLGDPAFFGRVLERWDGYALATRRALVAAMVTAPATAAPLLDAVARGDVAAAEVDPASRDALRGLNDPALKARAEAVLKSRPVADRAEALRRAAGALDLTPDPARGRALFLTHCNTCHARDGQGPKVGPDLISVLGRPKDDLLVAILDPAREAAPDGLGVVLLTTDGRTLTGLLAEETPAAVRIRRAGGMDDVVPRAEVEAIRPTGRSLMPDGLEQVLSPQDLADLIGFLRTPPGG